MSLKTYLIIAVGVTATFYLLGLLAGTGLISVVRQFQSAALGGGMSPEIGRLVIDPITWALSGDIFAALVVGLLWPLALVWVLLFFLVAIFAFLGPGVGAARSTIS